MSLSQEDCLLYVDKYQDAERLMKQIDIEVKEAIIPSVNELRYAGSHFGTAIITEDASIVKTELAEAITHICRAMYDSLVIGISFKIEFLENFQSKYNSKYVCVSKVIPDFAKSMTRARSLQENLTLKSRDEALDNGYIEIIREEFKFLKAFTNLLKEGAEELNVEVRKTLLKSVVGIVGILGGIAAILGVILNCFSSGT